MKKAINIGIFAEDTPYEQIFACLKSAGYAAAELNLFEEKKPFPSLWNGADEAELKAVAACAAKYGIELVGVVSAAFWNHKLTAEDAQERARAAETLRTLVRAAAALGTDSVLVVPGVADGSQSYLRALENAHGCIAAVLPEAEAKGICLAIENVWNKLFCSPVELRDYIDSFGSRVVKSYLDVGNMCKWMYPQHWVEVLGSRIHRVHVKGYNTDNNTFCGLHEGTMDWPAIIGALRTYGYDGYITAELWADGDVEEAVRGISADMDKILAS